MLVAGMIHQAACSAHVTDEIWMDLGQAFMAVSWACPGRARGDVHGPGPQQWDGGEGGGSEHELYRNGCDVRLLLSLLLILSPALLLCLLAALPKSPIHPCPSFL
jgi:hypothetical protein